MTTLDQLQQPTRPASSEASIAEQAKAVAEVAAAVRVAQDNPRDVTRSVERMRQSCRQRAMADRAFYSLPRAGGRVEGSTVHLARELAACWGNVDHGVRETRRDDEAGISEVIAWAWDQESNVRSSRSFVVPHARMIGKGAAKKREGLIDLTDIANNNNSVAARAAREVIWHIIPVWFRSEAEAMCAQTLTGDGTKTVAQQAADAAGHFADTFGVTTPQLETRLQRSRGDWTAQDVAYLRVLAGELSRAEKRIEDEFPPDTAPTGKVSSDELPSATAPAGQAVSRD